MRSRTPRHRSIKESGGPAANRMGSKSGASSRREGLQRELHDAPSLENGGPAGGTLASNAGTLAFLRHVTEASEELADEQDLDAVLLKGAPAPRGGTLWTRLEPYVLMARVDHWVKNAFMLLGVVVALLYRPGLFEAHRLPVIALAVLATCLIASSNYVINEYLDAPFDRLHPTKCTRPAAVGQLSGALVYAFWGLLAIAGMLLATGVNGPFAATALFFWIMGWVYNVPPLRAKDVAFVDVLVESVNNPIRLALGWFALIPDLLPPLSIALAFWMVGAFFMAAKRFAEYRQIADPEVAASYRKSFGTYDEGRLLGSMLFYAATGAVFGGVFLVRYKLELIFCVPSVTMFLGLYAWLSMRRDSPVQAPERLHKDPVLMASALLVLLTFLVAMFLDVPALYTLFNVEHAGIEPLWKVGD